MKQTNNIRELLLAGLLIVVIGCANKQVKTGDEIDRDVASISETDDSAVVFTPTKPAMTTSREHTAREYRNESLNRRAANASWTREYQNRDRLPASVETTDTARNMDERATYAPNPMGEVQATRGGNFVWLLLIALAALVIYAGVRRARSRRTGSSP